MFFSYGITIQAQEGIKPLTGNSILINHTQKNTHNAQKTTSSAVFLPFYDDFSYWGPYVDAAKWDMSQSVFVNRSYAIAPPTIGTATFDGLSRFGYPYNIAATSGNPTLSDTLLSIPIRLDYTDATQTVPITPADSVYLSFYYQLAGRGDRPETADALYLFFFAPGDTIDVNPNSNPNYVWSHPGSTLNLPASDTNFHRVMIPIYRSIDDTVYFKDTAAIKTGFRFAFSNLGTQCGAIDHWHIDLVYLNKGRSNTDTLFQDISFVYDEQSLLKNYMQMPYNQFAGASDMKTRISNAFFRNNMQSTVNVTTGYAILDTAGIIINQSKVLGNGSNNVNTYSSGGYCNDDSLVKPALTNSFTYNTVPFNDTTSFLLKFYLKNNLTGDTVHRNDTAYFRQKFHNYYSYDDGTAEAGYFAAFYNGEIAVKYKLNANDTLRAIDIFFDPVDYVNVIQSTNIGLIVWGDNSGHPGSILLADTSVGTLAYSLPAYSKNGYDVFMRYQLSKPVPLFAGTTFYVGTYQQTNVQLGVGLDLNTNTQVNNFYFDGTSWNTSSFKGSLMIHPVFGDSTSTVGIKSYAQEKESINMYPNPATDEIFISSAAKITKIIIADLLGNTLMEEKTNTKKITVSSLPNGLYLLRTFNTKGSSFTQKLIISR